MPVEHVFSRNRSPHGSSTVPNSASNDNGGWPDVWGVREISDLSRFLAYFVLTGVAWRAARGARPRDRPILVAVAAMGLGLGVSLLLGFAGLLASEGRDIAAGEGWYAERRPVQAAAVLGILIVSGAAIMLLPRLLRDCSPLARLLVAVMVLLAAYVSVHTISLHQLDAVLNQETLYGIRSGDWVEIALVAIAAVVAASMRGASACSGSRTASSPSCPQSGMR